MKYNENIKVFMVKHCYDEDGGFGDAVSKEECLMIFKKKEDAELFVRNFENPHIYEKPYDELECGRLKIDEVEVVDYENAAHIMEENNDCWWRDNIIK